MSRSVSRYERRRSAGPTENEDEIVEPRASRRQRRSRKQKRFADLRASLAYYRTGTPLLRYWWVVAIGAVVAVCVGILAAQAKRDPYQYTATAQMLVTSPEAPYFRFSITRQGTQELSEGEPSSTIIDTGPPDTDTLVQAANLYPLLMTSDLVAMERIAEFGETPGTVEARAIFATQSASRFSASSVPVIELSATSPTPEDAVNLADDTAAAFGAWITKQQETAGVKDDQRILIESISSARVVSQTGGPSYAIPVLLGAAVLLAFCGLAVLLDSLARRGRALTQEQSAPVAIPLGNATSDSERLREGSA